MKKLIFSLSLCCFALALNAQMVEPVKFISQLKTNSTAEAEIIFTATIDKGWHVYSTHLGDDGPIEASFHVEKMEGAELVGELRPVGKEISEYDEIFGMKLRYFEDKVSFVQKIRFVAAAYDIDCYLQYGACNDSSCLPPSEVSLKKQGASPAVAGERNDTPAGGETAPAPVEDTANAADTTALAGDVNTAATGGDDISGDINSPLWTPVIDVLEEQGGGSNTADASLWYIFLMGLIGGFVALLTPCVWPIIPMTVSFFLKKAKDNRAKGIRDAVTYGISIVVIYVALGLIITGLFGASSLNALSTSAVFNLFFFALLVVFALSFFGWFEIRLPEKWGNAVDSKASATSGLLSIFLMAFTLSLVSFSCTGPIIGFLLVEVSVSGSILGPAIGMLGFAIALALPFTLFAMFPSWLKSAPRSGSWMTTIKVVLGFIELAFSLKFLSVADLAYGWHILDREAFLALWIVIFGLMGLYLIGKLKFQSDTIGGETDKPMPVLCIMLGLVSLAFALYMVPGLWGAPCKAVSAFSPPMNTQDFNMNTKEVRAAYTDYEEAMAAARREHKPVFVDFTGFGCVNCRKMEAAVWTDPSVAGILQDDYVLVSLFVDDKTPLAERITVTESNGEQRTLRTVGDKWSYLQRHKFGANAQPFYVALDNDGNPLSGSFVYKEDVPAFLKFLNEGLKAYAK
ncbi:MAG: thioredoxin family protein [Prevotella sp.]|nr:thioredoxin family protein [Prevotella sp.]